MPRKAEEVKEETIQAELSVKDDSMSLSVMPINYEDIKKANDTIKTTDIKGKNYAEVNQRIKAFRMVYPTGYIHTHFHSIENGVCIILAEVGYYDNGERKELGTGMAYEKENSTFINKTSYIENCVPLSSQILTEDGWKYYFQLKEGEKVLSLNLETKQMEYCKLIRVNQYKDKPLVEMETSRFKARCTPEHKWVVRTQYKDIHKKPTAELTVSDKIVQAVKQQIESSKEGRILGWLICDCDIALTEDGMISTGYINQSKHIDDIVELFGEGKLTKKYNEAWKDNYEWCIPAETVREIYGRFGMATYKDLPLAMCKASIEDVKGCFDSMMLADGEERGFSSTYKELIEAVQIMCARLGIATSFIKSRMMEKSTKPIYTISIKKTDGAYFSEMKVRSLPPQDVWCPTTENGTWIMRQGDFVTLTSNCETSAVGRALGMAGFGIDVSVASAEEVQNAITNQEQAQKIDNYNNGKITAKDIEALKKSIKDVGVHEESICERYEVKALSDLTFKNFTEAMSILANQKKKAEEQKKKQAEQNKQENK